VLTTDALSFEKAKAVSATHPDAIIIAADTFLVVRDEIIGKSKDEREARKILQKLSGNSHSVVTGFTIIDSENGKAVTKSVETKVFFKKLSKRDIDWYIGTGEPVGIPGYKIQEKGSVLVEKIEGDFFNVIGLPLHSVIEELKKFSVRL
jgi:septum formation protein